MTAAAQGMIGFSHGGFERYVSSTEVTLPAKLTWWDWSSQQQACLEYGYDLRPYAGQKVLLHKYEFSLAGPMPVSLFDSAAPAPPKRTAYLWLVEKDSALVGAYIEQVVHHFSAPSTISPAPE